MINIISIHPGRILQKELESLRLSPREFSKRTGILEKQMSLLLSGEANVTVEIAQRLGNFFGQDPRFWLNLQAMYEQSKKLEMFKKSIDADFALLEKIEPKWRQRFIPDFNVLDKEESVRMARVAFQASTLANLDNNGLYVLYKETRSETKGDCFLQNIWLSIAIKEGKSEDDYVYNDNIFKKTLLKIRPLTLLSPDAFFPILKKSFAEAGVSLTVTPYLKNTGIFGASCWIENGVGEKHPLISLSNRGKSADLFWFSLVHESAHVLMHHTRNLLMNSDDTKASAVEAEADKLGGRILIPEDEWQNFTSRNERHTTKGVVSFAKRIGIDPCIVVGRLEREGRSERYMYQSLKKQYDFNFLFKEER